MSEGWILFLSVFLGIPTGGIVGALALKLLGSINNFYKRRELIINVKVELSLNLARLGILEKEFIGDLKVLDFDGYLNNRDEVFLRMKKEYYNMYLSNFILLKNINVIYEIIGIYDFDYITNIFKFYYYDLINAVRSNEKIIEEIDKINSGIQESSRIDSGFGKTQKILGDMHKLEIKNKARNKIESIKSKKIKGLTNVMKESIIDTKQRIENVLNSLDIIYKQNILIFWFGKNR